MATRRAHPTIVEFCEEMQIGRSTFYEWRTKSKAPMHQDANRQIASG